MEGKSRKPKIRFAGFAEDWEQRKLLDCFSEIIDFRGRTPKKLGLSWSETGYLALSALNVKDGYIDKSIKANYGDQKLYDAWMKEKELFEGQVLFTTEAPMGNIAQVPDNKKYILSQRTIAFRVYPNILTDNFLAISLKQPTLFSKLEALSSGGTAKGVSQKSLSEVEINLPISLSEQTCIGTFFRHLDHLITLHQRKRGRLENIKKAMLERMFPKKGADVPEVRFAGFTGAWEQRKLGDVGTSFDYGLNAAAKSFDGKNKYIRITDIDDKSRVFLQSDLTSPDINLAKAERSILQDGDIVFARTGASVGKTYIYDKTDGLVYFAGFLIRVRVKAEYDAYFIFQNTLTKSYENFINITSQRSGQPGVNAQEYTSFAFLTPSLSEQSKIGTFFRHLDHLITLHQRKLILLKNIKKACLANMFA